MADTEDILMQFTAQDDVTSVVEAMESSVTSSLEAISAAMDELDIGLLNLSSTAESVSSVFEDVSKSFETAEDAATSFQSSLSDINSDGLDDVTSDVQSVSDALMDAEGEVINLANGLADIDGMSVDVNIDASGIGGDASDWDADAELGGELTEQDTSALRTSMLDDMVGMSNTIRGLGDAAVESASAAEQGWLKFGNAVTNTGGNWEAQEASIRSWVKTYSNSMGRGVADTRTAMTTFMNMGMSLDETQKTMTAVSNYAAQFGISQSEAAKMIQMSFMGAGRSVKKLGLDIADFKDEAGNVDREKLLAAIMEKTSGAADKYANTYEARVQRMNNAINSLRTDFGKEIINTIEPLIPIVQQAFAAFSSLPQPIKSTVLAFGGLAGGVAIAAGPLLKIRAYMKMGGVDAQSFVKSIQNMQKAFNILKTDGISGAISELKKYLGLVKETETVSAGAEATKAGSSALSGASKGTSTVAKGTKEVVKDASAVGALAPEAAAAEGGIAATGGALSGISAAFTSMIVPLIAIAAVVAVMIPIIAGLVAEALLFIKGIQILIDALGFDDIDLSKAIEGIKQVGQALLEIGIAMAEMTFASIMTAATGLVNGITGLINPIKIAGEMLVQAANEMKVFETVKVDESVANNLKTISNALSSVSSAMSSLTNVVLTMAAGNIATLGGLLGDVNTAISTAREEITNASEEIAKIKDLPDIDESAVSKLEKISSSIESVAKAMDGLRGIRDGYNWDNFVQGIFPGVDIQTALDSVKQDIIDAGNALQDFTGIPEIPQGLGDKLKNIGDSLKGIDDAMNSLRGLRDANAWDAVLDFFRGDVISALNNSKTTLTNAANALSSLKDLPDIPDGIYTKVQRIGTSARNVGNVLNGLNNIAFPNIIGMAMIPANIAMSRGVLMNVATQLVTLQSLPVIPDGIYTKVQRIGTSARNVANTLRLMNTTSFPDVVSMALLPVKISAAKLVLENVGRELANLNTIPPVPEGVGVKIQRIGTGARSVGAAVQGINTIPFVGPDVALRVRSGVSAVKSVANELAGLQGMSVAGNIGQALASIRAAIVQLRGTLNSMRGGFRASGVGIGSSIKSGVRAGIAGLNGVVAGGVSVGMSAGIGPARSGGAQIGNAAKTSFQTSFKIAQVASAELNNATQALANGSGAFYAKVREIATQAVQEAKNAAGVNSPGHIANMWGDEMGYSSMMIETRGNQIIGSIRNITGKAVNAFNPNLTSQLDFTGPAFDSSRLDAIRRMNQSSNLGQGQRPVSIQIGEGAIQLDARNLTTTESRQIMINALEGLDDIKGIDI